MLPLTVRQHGGPRKGNARHRKEHAATRLPPAGPPKVCAEFFLPQSQEG